VIEVGLGGRLDATNVLNPLLTITTDISFDHMEILGDTLEKISIEKGGIIKTGVPHVTGILPATAAKVLSRICEERNAPLNRVEPERFHIASDGSSFDYRTGDLEVRNLHPSLAGEHQFKNAAVVLEAIAILRSHGFKVPLSAIRNGIAATTWRGRFQIIARRGRPTIILDVCHNAAGALAFAKTFAHRYPERRLPMIVGFVQKKEHQVMFDALSTVASEYLLVPLKTKRTILLEDLMQNIDFRGVPVRRCRSLAGAYGALVKHAHSDDIIPVIGSHYLVGEFLSRYG
jgi:dihydrofolate synthase / folylpolyglutamate synthase